jgi:hypothetical protein
MWKVAAVVAFAWTHMEKWRTVPVRTAPGRMRLKPVNNRNTFRQLSNELNQNSGTGGTVAYVNGKAEFLLMLLLLYVLFLG